MTQAQMQEFAVHVNSAFSLLDNMKPEDVERLQTAANQVVGLRDTGMFNLSVDVLTKAEIKEHRRKLAAAIAAEKFEQGFVFACQLMMMLSGI